MVFLLVVVSVPAAALFSHETDESWLRERVRVQKTNSLSSQLLFTEFTLFPMYAVSECRREHLKELLEVFR